MSNTNNIQAHSTSPLSLIIVPDRIRRDTPQIRAKIEENLVPSIQEHGLLQPILLTEHEPHTGLNIYNESITSNLSLVAGWSRLLSFSLLSYPSIPYNLLPAVEIEKHYAFELEENLRRHDMSWQEVVIGVDRIHHALRDQKKAEGKKWVLRQTGALFGQSYGYVQQALLLARYLKANDQEIWECKSLNDAIDIISLRKEAIIVQELERRQKREAEAIKSLTESIPSAPSAPFPSSPSPTPSLLGSENDQTSPSKRTSPTIDVSSKVLCGDSIYDLMPKMKEKSFDLIYTDIPYGIDMENLSDIKHIDLTADAHDVESNVEDMPQFLRQAYRVLKDKSYLLFWMDIKHWEKLKAWGEEAGFTVQPYPVLWHKADSAKNRAAHCWWTKDFEYVMVMRKGKATLAKAQNTAVFKCSNYHDRKKQDHPFSKPKEFSFWLLEPIMVSGMKVLDCYAGEGSLVEALLEMGADVTAIEKDKTHYPKLLERVKQYYRNLYGEGIKFV